MRHGLELLRRARAFKSGESVLKCVQGRGVTATTTTAKTTTTTTTSARGFAEGREAAEVKEADGMQEAKQDEAARAADEEDPSPSPSGTSPPEMPKEFGYKPKGLEPTRYGDWERAGRCSDF